MTSTTSERKSKHEVVYSMLRERVRSAMAAHEALPRERALMEEFGVSRVTVRQALARLREEGLVYSIHGSGTYVSETGMVSKSLRLASFSEDMRERGLTPSARVLSTGVALAGAEVSSDLRLPPGSGVVCIKRLRLADHVPMAIEQVEIPHDMVPGLETRDLGGSLYDLLQSEYGLRVDRAMQTIRASVADVEQAELLTVAPFSPVLIVRRVGADRRENPIERATTIYRADRYEFRLASNREY